ncbi:MAG: GDSL-type esterase/lipase family protein [Clostridia bacterium]
MNVLNIVLVSAFGFCLILLIVYLCVIKSMEVNRANSYNLINKSAKKGEIVFFGDSLTDFFPLQEFIDVPTIYNRGIAGNTTANLLARLDNVIGLQPSKLFLQIGTNDLSQGKKPAFIVANIKKIVDQIKLACPNIKVYVISTYPIRRRKNLWAHIVCGLRTINKLQKINALLEKLCKEEGLSYINMWDTLCDEKNICKKEYTVEGLHITILGYCAITQVLRPYIEE